MNEMKVILLYLIFKINMPVYVFHFRQVQFESILNDTSSDEEEFCRPNIPAQSIAAVQKQPNNDSSAMQIDNFTDRDEASIFEFIY